MTPTTSTFPPGLEEGNMDDMGPSGGIDEGPEGTLDIDGNLEEGNMDDMGPSGGIDEGPEGTLDIDGNLEGTEPYRCEEGLDNWQKGWSESKKGYCCKRHRLGCKFDCD